MVNILFLIYLIQVEVCKRDGRKLWASVTAEFELAEAEVPLLERACRAADYINELDAVIERDGLGDPCEPGRIHPAMVESRLQTQLLARLLVALRMPDDEGVRPQYRGMRGHYRKARAEHVAAQRLRVLK